MVLLSRKSAPSSKVVTVQSQMQSSQLPVTCQKNSASQPTVAHIVEHTLGCKWMLEALRQDLSRYQLPRSNGLRATEGLTTKVAFEMMISRSRKLHC